MFLYRGQALLLFFITLSGVSAWAAAPAPAVEDRTTSGAAATAAPPGGEDVFAPYYGKKFMRGPASVKKVALTFDDGPHGKLTPRVIEILKREKVGATFFMLGESVEKYPDTARMVADAGFEIGCHSMTHPNMRRMGLDEIRAQINGSADLIEKTTGKRPHLFRPPYGDVTAAIRAVCAQSQMVIVHWSVDPRDWYPKSTPDSVYNATMKQISGGAIVCIHDIHAKTVEALPRLIAGIKAQGYTLTTVGDLLGEAEKHKLTNPGGAAGGQEMGSASQMLQPAAISLDKSAVQ